MVYEGVFILHFVIFTRTFSLAMCFFAMGCFGFVFWVFFPEFQDTGCDAMYHICKAAELASQCTRT